MLTQPLIRKICVIGERGVVSQRLQNKLATVDFCEVSVLRTADVLAMDDCSALAAYDVIVLATLEYASPSIVSKLPLSVRVLDVSPAFRVDPHWVYGLAELPGAKQRITAASRVANPGCFATAAILLLAPLIQAKLLSPGAPVYLDAAGGFSTGGSVMAKREAEGLLHSEAVYSLTREHLHIAEIKQACGLTGLVWFTPKIVHTVRGIRMQVPLFGLDKEEVLATYARAYENTLIEVVGNVFSRIAVDFWSNRPGACLHVIEQIKARIPRPSGRGQASFC
ncbi:MAG: hypothetical protein Q7S87_18235 [Agitococcus sp.]|nr:hypothetical protein [Agitococcus sp.]